MIRVGLPVNVELVKIRTIFELTGGRFSSEPAKIKSMVRSSMVDELVRWLVVGDRMRNRWDVLVQGEVLGDNKRESDKNQ